MLLATWYNWFMKNTNLAAEFAIKHDDREDFKHSSGYAKAQSGDNFGAESVVSFETRKAINESRKYVQGYKKSKIGMTRISEIHPKQYVREEDMIRRESSEKTPPEPGRRGDPR